MHRAFTFTLRYSVVFVWSSACRPETCGPAHKSINKIPASTGERTEQTAVPHQKGAGYGSAVACCDNGGTLKLIAIPVFNDLLAERKLVEYATISIFCDRD